MPLYEYECVKCRNQVEELHSSSSKPKILCDKCGEVCERIVSRPSIHGTALGKSRGYVVEKAVEKGKMERDEAQAKSHMGPDPYETLSASAPDILD